MWACRSPWLRGRWRVATTFPLLIFTRSSHVLFLSLSLQRPGSRRCLQPPGAFLVGSSPATRTHQSPPAMAAKCAISAPSFLAHQPLCRNKPSKRLAPCLPSQKRNGSVRVSAAKLPPGVEVPRIQPKLSEPFLGFTETAEIWNSRACMIGLIGTFIVELVLNKGILQIIGVEVGKGLDLPL